MKSVIASEVARRSRSKLGARFLTSFGTSPAISFFLRRLPRLRAETLACMKRFGEGRHFGVQARTLRVLAMTMVWNLGIFSLTGKTAIVTGASRSVGEAIVKGFAQAGADLYLASDASI